MFAVCQGANKNQNMKWGSIIVFSSFGGRQGRRYFRFFSFHLPNSYALLCTDINSLILFCNYLTYKRDMALSYLKFNFNWGH